MRYRVAIDLRMLAHPLGGVARYALEMARGLPAAAPELEPWAVGKPVAIRRHLPHAHVIFARSAPVSLGDQLELPRLLARHRADLFHATVHAGPIGISCPMVLTIHDTLFVDEPALYGRRMSLYLRTVGRALATRSRAVLTVSEFSRWRLVSVLRIPVAKISVTPNGVSPWFRPVPDEDVARLRKRLGLPSEYLLYAGGFLPHKNVPVLVRAFARLRHAPPLVLCGPGATDLLPLAVRLGVDRQIHFLPGQTDQTLPALYSGATAFVFPSRYEGFGLPPLEAMACGTPTVVADAGSLPEVTGGAALLFPPDDDAALAERLQDLLDSPTLRSRLSKAGREQAARFRWEECVRKTAEVYRQALA